MEDNSQKKASKKSFGWGKAIVGGVIGAGLFFFGSYFMNKGTSEEISQLKEQHVQDSTAIVELINSYDSLNREFDEFFVGDEGAVEVPWVKIEDFENLKNNIARDKTKIKGSIEEEIKKQNFNFARFKGSAAEEHDRMWERINNNSYGVKKVDSMFEENMPKLNNVYAIIGKNEEDSIENNVYKKIEMTIEPWIYGQNNRLGGGGGGLLKTFFRDYRPLHSLEKKELEFILNDLGLKDEVDSLAHELYLGKTIDPEVKSAISHIAYNIFERHLETSPYKKYSTGIKTHRDVVNQAYLDSIKQSL